MGTAEMTPSFHRVSVCAHRDREGTGHSSAGFGAHYSPHTVGCPPSWLYPYSVGIEWRNHYSPLIFLAITALSGDGVPMFGDGCICRACVLDQGVTVLLLSI